MRFGWKDLQRLHQMLPWENWITKNDRCCKRKLHGEDMDESANQKYAEKGPSSEKKHRIHSNAEQIYR